MPVAVELALQAGKSWLTTGLGPRPLLSRTSRGTAGGPPRCTVGHVLASRLRFIRSSSSWLNGRWRLHRLRWLSR
jgi:hypothetical protein